MLLSSKIFLNAGANLEHSNGLGIWIPRRLLDLLMGLGPGSEVEGDYRHSDASLPVFKAQVCAAQPCAFEQVSVSGFSCLKRGSSEMILIELAPWGIE